MDFSKTNSVPNPLFQKIEQVRRRPGKVRDTHITLAHGSGGKAMRDLIDDIFVNNFDNPILSQLEDQATINLSTLLQQGERLAFTTDSYVVDPLFFPGSDIGELAINGTINDLAVSGAKPLYFTCSVILEEGLPIETLRRVATSMKVAAQKAGVQIVTGDTKVVPRGCADKLFINTAGIGIIPSGIDISAHNIQPGDSIIINGELGNHGAAILIARGELALETNIESDCQALHDLVATILNVCPQVHAMRDATRGGLATVLNEFATSSHVGIRLYEESLPVREEVKGMCEILGLDPLYLANEGKLVVVVDSEQAQAVLSAMKSHPKGRDACIVGEVMATPPGVVFLKTTFGTERIVDMLVGEQLPRIC
ncbi:hydrogenase expression/formation protein HypE [Anabaena sp. FACHB-709]|uniref:Hydrogenase expression/formation protein HupE n=2 Tax=Nostocaceae TaxID=1162 RepID=A0A1Z4KRU9_ANAVA|nr:MULTISPECIES: hydrogenase expression/formation protein HypE [Nostocaceae]BAY71674.1 hydrogenase expression/formation protein HupE [Trichormus variabilis NIES-23]HBW32337.1 hydrogenase expression/formation protein HypE [Nostoc sp. UBA8866]MBD2172521.1 hydrogenase expression/formation protein HypE [Anabaena cylindrica FACHB-318]MBD2264013.1 hydrogenase expression/formation protein HypE [Anabaena sp. FACHB-709]MBD2273459.1 hydrogenase expression/formation protein HypE [Nostoc sp. PCC 7120 = FA